MNNDPAARVNAEMAVLRAEIEHLQAEMERRLEKLNRLEIYLEVHRDLFDTSGSIDQINKAETVLTSRKRSVQLRKRGSKTSLSGIRQPDFRPFVRAMLLEHGRPMNKEEMHDGFKRKGRDIGGKPEFELNNLGKKLARAKKEIKRISGAGYWPIDVPCPEVSYTPP